MSPRKTQKQDRRRLNPGRPSQGLSDVEHKVRLSKPVAADFRSATKAASLPSAADAWRKAVALFVEWAKSLNSAENKT